MAGLAELLEELKSHRGLARLKTQKHNIKILFIIYIRFIIFRYIIYIFIIYIYYIIFRFIFIYIYLILAAARRFACLFTAADGTGIADFRHDFLFFCLFQQLQSQLPLRVT